MLRHTRKQQIIDEIVLPGVGNFQGWQACPLLWPFGPCNRQHFQSQWDSGWLKTVSQQETVEELPCLEIRHLQPAGKIAVDCICPLTADPSKAPSGSQVPENELANFRQKLMDQGRNITKLRICQRRKTTSPRELPFFFTLDCLLMRRTCSKEHTNLISIQQTLLVKLGLFD